MTLFNIYILRMTFSSPGQLQWKRNYLSGVIVEVNPEPGELFYINFRGYTIHLSKVVIAPDRYQELERSYPNFTLQIYKRTF